MSDIVFVENSRAVTDSLTVAKVFGKSHDKVLRDIRELGCSEDFRLANFGESSYTNQQGREMPKYIISEQGFTLLAMGYTGPRAMEFKERYIAEFDRMRKLLQNPSQTQPDTLKSRRLDIMEMNAKARVAKLIFDTTKQFSNQLSPVAIETMLAAGVNLVAGKELIAPPRQEKLYSATEIAKEAGTSANKIGRIANEYNLKTEEYGEFVLDKSPYSSKEISAFRYNEKGRERILQLLAREPALTH